VMNKGVVEDILTCNKTLAYAKEHKNDGFHFRPGVVDWSVPGGSVMLTIADASHANEFEFVDVTQELEPYRTQGGRITALASLSVISGEECNLHPFSTSSTSVKRVTRATVQGETYNLQSGVEFGDVMRAAIADMHDRLDRNDWERTSSMFMKHVWCTDCKSSEAALCNPVMGKIQDKRLGIEFAALRQSLWRVEGQALGDPRLCDALPDRAIATDICRWIDTDVMLADPLTKPMDASKMLHAMKTNYWDMKQPIESLRKKREKQRQRHKTPMPDDAVEGDMPDLATP
jgi:hypothetical protein